MRVLALLAIAAVSVRAGAQMSEVLPGARVRVSIPGSPRLDGAIVSRTQDSLVIAKPPGETGAPGTRVSVALKSLEAIDLFHGRSRREAAKRAGLWTGLIVTVLDLTTRRDTSTCGHHCPSLGQTLVLSNLLLDPMAAWIGAAIGKDVWTRHRPTDADFGVTPQAARSLVTIDSAAVPPAGARVRVTAPGALATGLEATIIGRSSDSLVLATTSAVEYRVSLASISSIDRFDGNGAGAGAKHGFWIGALVGLPFVLFVPIDVSCHVGCALGVAAIADASYAGIGAAIGAAVGADQWTSVRLRPSISALPGKRFGIGMSIR